MTDARHLRIGRNLLLALVLTVTGAAAAPAGSLTFPLVTRAGAPQNQTDGLLNYYDWRYYAVAEIGGQNLSFLLDTGSADTTVISAVFPPNMPAVANGSLILAPLYRNESEVGVQHLNRTYAGSYGTGVNQILGAMNRAKLSMRESGISLEGLMYYNQWQPGGNEFSAMFGLGPPWGSLMFGQMLYAQNATGTPFSPDEAKAYWPLVPLMYHQGQIKKNIFSLVFNRIGNAIDAQQRPKQNYSDMPSGGGSLTFGDYPAGYKNESFTWLPVRGITSDPGTAGLLGMQTPYLQNRWTVGLVDIYFNGQRLNRTQTVNGTSGALDLPAALDTGNAIMHLQGDVISQIVPTGAYNSNPQGATIPCNSTFDLAFEFRTVDNTTVRYTMPRDEVLVPSTLVYDNDGLGTRATQECQFIAQPRQPYPGIFSFLGMPVLRQFASVWDFGNIDDLTKGVPKIGLKQV